MIIFFRDVERVFFLMDNIIDKSTRIGYKSYFWVIKVEV
jgi:hypothetical protein